MLPVPCARYWLRERGRPPSRSHRPENHWIGGLISVLGTMQLVYNQIFVSYPIDGALPLA